MFSAMLASRHGHRLSSFLSLSGGVGGLVKPWQAGGNIMPALVLWGERDPAFIADGARAYLRDLPHAELHLLDAGHFAAEERTVQVAQHLLTWLVREVSP